MPRTTRFPRVDAEEFEQLLGPLESPGDDIPIPDPRSGRALGQCESLGARPQSRLCLLQVGDVHDCHRTACDTPAGVQDRCGAVVDEGLATIEAADAEDLADDGFLGHDGAGRGPLLGLDRLAVFDPPCLELHVVVNAPWVRPRRAPDPLVLAVGLYGASLGIDDGDPDGERLHHCLEAVAFLDGRSGGRFERLEGLHAVADIGAVDPSPPVAWRDADGLLEVTVPDHDLPHRRAGSRRLQLQRLGQHPWNHGWASPRFGVRHE